MSKRSNTKDSLEVVADQQRELVSCIFNSQLGTRGFNREGVEIYRRNLQATATKALAITYPTIQQLIGEPFFSLAAETLLEKEPPIAGDWAKWGESFPDILAQMEALDDYPYVFDCARLDYAIHEAERAKNNTFRRETLGLLAEIELDHLYIEIPECLNVLEAGYPVIELWHLHHSGSPEHYVEVINQRVINNELEQYVLVCRPQYKAQLRVLTQAEYLWMSQLMQGQSIGHALDILGASSFKFEQWLPSAIKHNCIKRFYEKPDC